jgi:uncharacterized UBP type Zn finger protein
LPKLLLLYVDRFPSDQNHDKDTTKIMWSSTMGCSVELPQRTGPDQTDDTPEMVEYMLTAVIRHQGKSQADGRYVAVVATGGEPAFVRCDPRHSDVVGMG